MNLHEEKSLKDVRSGGYRLHRILLNGLARIIANCKPVGNNKHTTQSTDTGVEFSGEDDEYIYKVTIIRKTK